MIESLLDGISIDQKKFLICTFLQYPSSYIISKISSANTMHIFNILVGFLLQIYIFEKQFLISLLSTIFCYLCLHIDNKKFSAYVTLFVSMTCLSAIHIYRMIADYGNWTLDINVILMINVCKYTSVAFCNYDSDRDDKVLTEYMQKHKLVKIPSALEYFSYIYFVPSCIIGPFFEIKDFLDFANKKEDYAYENKISSYPTVIKKFFLGLLFAMLLVVCGKISNIDIILDYNNEYSSFRKIIAILFAYTIKYRYYVGWLFTESMMALTGLGFQIKNPEQSAEKESTEESQKETSLGDEENKTASSIQDYNRIINIDVYEMEFNPHPMNVFRYWNITTAVWLKRYVRDRFIFYKDLNPSKTVKNISFLATFMISAFWHGFYPSYYIMFMHFPFMIMLYQNFSKINKIYKIDEKYPKVLLNVVHYSCVLVLMNLTGMIFSSLDYQKAFAIIRKTYYLLSIYIFGGYLATVIILRFSRSAIPKKDN